MATLGFKIGWALSKEQARRASNCQISTIIAENGYMSCRFCASVSVSIRFNEGAGFGMAAGCGHACAISGAVMQHSHTIVSSSGFHTARAGAVHGNSHAGNGLFRALKNALPCAPPNRPGAFGFLRY